MLKFSFMWVVLVLMMAAVQVQSGEEKCFSTTREVPAKIHRCCKAEFLSDMQKVAFISLGSYYGANGLEAKYYLSKLFVSEWQHARSICQSYGMEFLSIESEAEQSYLLNLLSQHQTHFGVHEWVSIGAMTSVCRSQDLWYWVDTGKKVNFPLAWGYSNPNCENDNEMCMCLGKNKSGSFYMGDIWCKGAPLRFMCKV